MIEVTPASGDGTAPDRSATFERAAVAEAFDRAAGGYDEVLRDNTAWLLFRHTVRERLQRLFVRGMRVLDLGCGTGEDALFLAEAGVNVSAIDVSSGMVERARAKAEEMRISSSLLSLEVRAVEDVAGIGGCFQGAYSSFGALNCADLPAVGSGLAGLLEPGAPVLLGWMGPHPLPNLVRRGLRGRRGTRPAHVAGVPLTVRYPTLRRVRALMGPDFAWRAAFALGVLVPAPEFAGWPVRHPALVALLAGLESVVRRWPFLRGLGDHLVCEGARR
jgi:SAM-dependent methyltransferase